MNVNERQCSKEDSELDFSLEQNLCVSGLLLLLQPLAEPRKLHLKTGEMCQRPLNVLRHHFHLWRMFSD